MPKFQYSPPLLIKTLFPEFIWSSKSNSVLLTFDDGPNPGSTEGILETLEILKIKAMFFCVGNNIDRSTSLAAEIIESGHSIGNHTYNHRIITNMKFDEALSEINHMNEIVSSLLGYSVKYFRPPHGKFRLNTSKLMKKSGMRNVMWSLLPYDFNNNLSLVKSSVHRYLKKDSIIVLHDSNKSKEIIRDSILYIADEVFQRGYRFGDPEECLK